MNNNLKLMIVAAVIVLTGAFAAKTTTFGFRYPEYLYIYTNLDVEYFFFDEQSPGSNPGTYETKQKKYDVATQPNLEKCLVNMTLPSPVTAQTSAGSELIRTGKCDFVATDTKKNKDFEVKWGSTGEKPDGALLILTNAPSWTAAAYINEEFGEVGKMVTLQVRTEKNTLEELSASESKKTVVGKKSGSTMTNAYYTDFVNAYVVPLQFVMVLDAPFSTPKVEDKAQVTYTISSP